MAASDGAIQPGGCTCPKQVNRIGILRNRLTDAIRKFRFLSNTKMLDDALSGG
jgi:hypothetical protein